MKYFYTTTTTTTTTTTQLKTEITVFFATRGSIYVEISGSFGRRNI